MTAASPLRIGFLGAGKMATALARGWRDAGLVTAEHLTASDPVPAARDGFARQTGGHITDRNPDVVRRCDVLVLAVKPQTMAALLEEIAAHVEPRHLVVSIAAGVTLDRLARALGASC